jgi:hypothetical protein
MSSICSMNEQRHPPADWRGSNKMPQPARRAALRDGHANAGTAPLLAVRLAGAPARGIGGAFAKLSQPLLEQSPAEPVDVHVRDVP